MKPIHRKFFIVMLFLMLIAALNLGPGAAPAFTQPASLSQPELDTLKADFQRLKIDLERLKTDLEEVKRELRFIRQSLGQSSSQSTQPGRVVTTVSISGNPIMGKKDAPVTLIEFSNYQCLLCSQFFQITLPELKGGYIDTGKVRYIFRDLPLDQIYPHARKAAEAAHCAGDQGKYWEMHDLLFQNQQALQVEKLKGYAGNLDLDLTAFDDCLEKGKYATEVQEDYEDGISSGVREMPAFFVGKTRRGDTIQGVLISGARPITLFRQVIETLLREK